MDHLPVFLDLRGREVVVIGGGEVAARKVDLLLEAGAAVCIVSPGLCAALAVRLERREVQHVAGEFQAAHLDRAAFVIAATNNPLVNRRVAEAGAARRLFVNAVDDADASNCLMPAIVDRSPVLVAIGTGGSSPTLARRVRMQIEALLPANLGAGALLAGRWRQRVQQALPDVALRRRFWDRWFSSAAGLPAASGAADQADAALESALAQFAGTANGQSAASRGEVWLVGAGPGDPDLLTLRALQLLSECDVVLHDRLVSDAVLARVRRDAERVDVGKRSGRHRATQERINQLLLDYAGRGLRVLRLKGGDPLLFARGGEELAVLLAAGIPVTVVPGITAASGAAARAQLSLTQRGKAQAVCLVTAMGEQAESLDWRALAAPNQTVVFYMGVAELPRIVAKLLAEGAPAARAVVIVEHATLPGERVLHATLANVGALATQAGVSAPALLIVGEVAATGRAMAVPAMTGSSAMGKA